MAALIAFRASRGRPLKLPIRFYKDRMLRPYLLWRAVTAYGGAEMVCISSNIGRLDRPLPSYDCLLHTEMVPAGRI